MLLTSLLSQIILHIVPFENFLLNCIYKRSAFYTCLNFTKIVLKYLFAPGSVIMVNFEIVNLQYQSRVRGRPLSSTEYSRVKRVVIITRHSLAASPTSLMSLATTCKFRVLTHTIILYIKTKCETLPLQGKRMRLKC